MKRREGFSVIVLKLVLQIGADSYFEESQSFANEWYSYHWWRLAGKGSLPALTRSLFASGTDHCSVCIFHDYVISMSVAFIGCCVGPMICCDSEKELKEEHYVLALKDIFPKGMCRSSSRTVKQKLFSLLRFVEEHYSGMNVLIIT